MAFFPFKYTTPQYGEKDYRKAVSRYDTFANKYTDLISSATGTTQTAIEKASGLTDYYQPGGGYGAGRKAEAKQTIEGGTAKSLGAAVSSGMASNFATRGINVLAASELEKLYQNIDDTRNQLLMQAFTPYAQMIQTLGSLTSSAAQVATAAPKRSQYVTQGKPYISGYSNTRGM